jgi:predicted nuclease of predicted toxin-antitoxin system
MKIRFQADADFHGQVVTALKRQYPEIDIQSAQTANLEGLPDEEVLALAAREGRILLTHDRRTMPEHFALFISHTESPGVFIVPQHLGIGATISEIVLLWEASTPDEWKNFLGAFPL